MEKKPKVKRENLEKIKKLVDTNARYTIPVLCKFFMSGMQEIISP